MLWKFYTHFIYLHCMLRRMLNLRNDYCIYFNKRLKYGAFSNNTVSYATVVKAIQGTFPSSNKLQDDYFRAIFDAILHRLCNLAAILLPFSIMVPLVQTLDSDVLLKFFEVDSVIHPWNNWGLEPISRQPLEA